MSRETKQIRTIEHELTFLIREMGSESIDDFRIKLVLLLIAANDIVQGNNEEDKSNRSFRSKKFWHQQYDKLYKAHDALRQLKKNADPEQLVDAIKLLQPLIDHLNTTLQKILEIFPILRLREKPANLDAYDKLLLYGSLPPNLDKPQDLKDKIAQDYKKKQLPLEVKQIAARIDGLPSTLGIIIAEYAESRITIEMIVKKLKRQDRDFSGYNFHEYHPETAQEIPLDLKPLLEKFGGKCFVGAKFIGANLDGIDFSLFLKKNINFIGAQLRHAILYQPQDVNYAEYGIPIEGCDFSGADLSHAIFHYISINKSKFNGAKLNGSLLYAANFEENDIEGAIFDGSKLNNLTEFESDKKAKQQLCQASWQLISFSSSLTEGERRLKFTGNFAQSKNTYFANEKFLNHLANLNYNQPENITEQLLLIILTDFQKAYFHPKWVDLALEAIHKKDSEKAILAAHFLSMQSKFSLLNLEFIRCFQQYTGKSVVNYLTMAAAEWNVEADVKQRIVKSTDFEAATTTAQKIQTFGFIHKQAQTLPDNKKDFTEKAQDAKIENPHLI